MPKKINYTLTESELLTIEQAIKSDPDGHVQQRALIIRLLHKGRKPDEVADVLSISVGQVYWWHKRWRQEGLAGLSDKERSGRPQADDEAYRQRLEQVLETEPHELGYGFNVWDTPRLMAHMEKETGVTMTDRTFRNVLDRMDYVYRRPKHDLTPLQDKEAKEQAEETIDALKKSRKRRNRTFLCGRNDPDPALWLDQVLDETRLSKTDCCSGNA
jgi:transposase